jgi:hypothetical protein
MVGTEVEGVGLDFFLGKEKLLIDIEFDRVDPVAVVPDVEIFLILVE